MYRLRLVCFGVPRLSGLEAASDITKEFSGHRRWFSNVTCRWDGERLILQPDSDVDSDGRALLDEFSDCVSAYVAGDFESNILIESVEQVLGGVTRPGRRSSRKRSPTRR
jgi:hypothetical protein